MKRPCRICDRVIRGSGAAFAAQPDGLFAIGVGNIAAGNHQLPLGVAGEFSRFAVVGVFTLAVEFIGGCEIAPLEPAFVGYRPFGVRVRKRNGHRRTASRAGERFSADGGDQIIAQQFVAGCDCAGCEKGKKCSGDNSFRCGFHPGPVPYYNYLIQCVGVEPSGCHAADQPVMGTVVTAGSDGTVRLGVAGRTGLAVAEARGRVFEAGVIGAVWLARGFNCRPASEPGRKRNAPAHGRIGRVPFCLQKGLASLISEACRQNPQFFTIFTDNLNICIGATFRSNVIACNRSSNNFARIEWIALTILPYFFGI